MVPYGPGGDASSLDHVAREPHGVTDKVESSPRFATVVGRLTGVNGLVLLLAFVTSPILARTLGPSGRGDLAAIFAVLVLAPTVADLGLYVYVTREHAREAHRLGDIIGSTVPIALAVSMVGVVLAVPIAHALGRGRHLVVLFIELGLYMLPLSVFLQTLFGVVSGAQRFGIVMVSRVLSSGGVALAIVGLGLTGHLTVGSVATAYIVFGLVANLPFLIGLRGSSPWRFRMSIARDGLAFGVRSWLSTIATQTNAKLDQVLMAALVSSRELGLYALAVTLASTANIVMNAISVALIPRVARGDPSLAARASRLSVLCGSVYGVALGLSSPVLVPLIFGSAFRGVVPMLIVLLMASLFNLPGQILSTAMIATGQPGVVARSQLVALAVTVPALVFVLPSTGGLGAALVSLAAYAISFAIVLPAATRHFGLTARAFTVVDGSDILWLRARFRRSSEAATSDRS